MPSKPLSFILLASVTTAERAAAIEGDLLEERASRGKWWFVVHVVRTTFALFGLALLQAPLRTLALSCAAVAASCLVCPAVGTAFFGPRAWIPVPLLGFAAIVASASLIGAALVRIAGAVGVRAAVATSFLLLVMFLFSQTVASVEQPGAIATFDVYRFALRLGLGFCVYLGPLMFASAWAHTRRL